MVGQFFNQTWKFKLYNTRVHERKIEVSSSIMPCKWYDIVFEKPLKKSDSSDACLLEFP